MRMVDARNVVENVVEEEKDFSFVDDDRDYYFFLKSMIESQMRNRNYDEAMAETVHELITEANEIARSQGFPLISPLSYVDEHVS